MSAGLPVVYSCSGCSSAAQMANYVAVRLDRQGLAEMSCIAGVGGGVVPLVKKARSAGIIIGVDGCPLHCVQHCLRREGLTSTFHYDLSKYGVVKKQHQDFDPKDADEVAGRIIEDLGARRNSSGHAKSIEI